MEKRTLIAYFEQSYKIHRARILKNIKMYIKLSNY